MMSFDMLRDSGYVWEYNGRSGPHALLASGNHSDIFINATAICCDPRLLNGMISAFYLYNNLGLQQGDTIDDHVNVDIVVCPGYGALGLAAAIAGRIGVPWGFTDKVDGQHVLKRFDVSGKHVLICEDVTTTFGSMIHTINAVKEAGGIIHNKAFTMFNRSGCINQGLEGDTITVIGMYNIPPSTLDPNDCPLCRSGSIAKRPKENWVEFMRHNRKVV